MVAKQVPIWPANNAESEPASIGWSSASIQSDGSHITSGSIFQSWRLSLNRSEKNYAGEPDDADGERWQGSLPYQEKPLAKHRAVEYSIYKDRLQPFILPRANNRLEPIMAGKGPREYPEEATNPPLRSRRAQSQEASRPERLVAASARQECMASEMNVGILQLCQTDSKSTAAIN